MKLDLDIKKSYIKGAGISAAIIIVSLFFINTRFFLLLIGAGIIAGILPFVFETVRESREDTEKEEMFIEFARNLVESVKTGTPISKSILNTNEKEYGIFGPHIKKLSNQISIGIPLGSALEVFAKDVNNKTVSRAIALIGQAEKSGGDIGGILESVAEAVSTADKLKKERAAVISSLVSQGYIIFFVFLIIILVMQFKIIPLLSTIGTNIGGAAGFSAGAGGAINSNEIANAFFYLLLIQGLFTGLTIGKLAGGTLKSGIKHSFILVFISFIVSAGANIFFG